MKCKRQFLQPGISSAGLISLFIVAVCGCAEVPSEEHHLEHLIPAHKPMTFQDGVLELQVRGDAYFHGDLTGTQHQELLDIITWLPELAADSDLSRGQWEQVRAVEQKMQRLVAAVPSEHGHQQWDELTSSLQKLVPYAVADDGHLLDDHGHAQPGQDGHTNVTDNETVLATRTSEETSHDARAEMDNE